MKEKKSRDLEKAAKRKKRLYSQQIKKPHPFKWKIKVSSQFIEDAIHYGQG